MSYVVIILTLGLFGVLAVKTNLLRDSLSCKVPDGKNTFSLSRTQFGIWTVVIFCSFVYLLTVSAQPIRFTETTAILLGISAGTTVISRGVDKNADNQTIKNKTNGNGCSQGFLPDLLSDSSGISIHRFQQVLFTLLLIYVFIDSLVTSKNFPDIDPYLLVLSGVSSGGYLGVKMSEK